MTVLWQLVHYTFAITFVCTRPNGTKPFDINPNGIEDLRITQVCKWISCNIYSKSI